MKCEFIVQPFLRKFLVFQNSVWILVVTYMDSRIACDSASVLQFST